MAVSLSGTLLLVAVLIFLLCMDSSSGLKFGTTFGAKAAKADPAVSSAWRPSGISMNLGEGARALRAVVSTCLLGGQSIKCVAGKGSPTICEASDSSQGECGSEAGSAARNPATRGLVLVVLLLAGMVRYAQGLIDGLAVFFELLSIQSRWVLQPSPWRHPGGSTQCC